MDASCTGLRIIRMTFAMRYHREKKGGAKNEGTHPEPEEGWPHHQDSGRQGPPGNLWQPG